MSEFNIDDLDAVISSADSSLVQMLALQLKKQISISKASEQQLAAVVAENAGLKAGALQEIEVINRGGQAYCVKDGMSVNPIYARGWNDYRAKSLSVETPATDTFLAEARAQGVEMVIAYHRERADALHHVDRNNAIRHSMAALDASDVAAQLRQQAAQ